MIKSLVMNECTDPQPLESLVLQTTSPAETERLGERLGALLESGDLVLLSGQLGAGKTCLTRGLARGWGAQEQPTSPTFTLVNEYHRQGNFSKDRFYHADCYRMDRPEDAISAGIEDLLNEPGVLVIEWPERIESLLPPERLMIEIGTSEDDSRSFTLKACGERARKLLDHLRG